MQCRKRSTSESKTESERKNEPRLRCVALSGLEKNADMLSGNQSAVAVQPKGRVINTKANATDVLLNLTSGIQTIRARGICIR